MTFQMTDADIKILTSDLEFVLKEYSKLLDSEWNFDRVRTEQHKQVRHIREFIEVLKIATD